MTNGGGDLEYPLHDKTITVTNCGRICPHKKKINFSEIFAGQKVGIRATEDKIWP
jgi:putative transposase